MKNWLPPARGWPVTAALILYLSLALSATAADDMAETGTAPDAIEKTSERGPVTVTVRLEPSSPVIGDSLTLTLTVVAEQGVELLMPEFGQSLDRFTILDFLPRQRIDDVGRTVATQRYTLQPPLSGEQHIPPIMIEFVDRRSGQRSAPENEDAFELLTERLTFTVQSVVPEQAAADLKPPLGKLEALATPSAPLWPWLLGAATVLAAIAPFGWRAWRAWRTRARRRSAYDIAYTRLQTLMARPKPGSEAMDAFFVELSDIIRRYLEDRFALHAPELTTEEFLDIAAGSPDLTQEHQGFLREFLQSADRVKFARHIPDAEHVEGALAAAARFLEQTKEAAPLVEESTAAPTEAARA